MIHEGMTVILDAEVRHAYRRMIKDRQKYHGVTNVSRLRLPFPKIKTLLWSSAVARSAIKRDLCMDLLLNVLCRILMPI